MKLLRNNWATCLAMPMVLILFLSFYFLHFDPLSFVLRYGVHVDQSEFDEIIVGCLLVLCGLIVDRMRALSRASRRSEIDQHRLHVLQATMRSVNDLVNNFLNNLQLFRMEGEDAALSPESLELMDSLIHETAAKLKALGESESVIEYKMANGTGVLPMKPLLLAD